MRAPLRRDSVFLWAKALKCVCVSTCIVLTLSMRCVARYKEVERQSRRWKAGARNVLARRDQVAAHVRVFASPLLLSRVFSGLRARRRWRLGVGAVVVQTSSLRCATPFPRPPRRSPTLRSCFATCHSHSHRRRLRRGLSSPASRSTPPLSTPISHYIRRWEPIAAVCVKEGPITLSLTHRLMKAVWVGGWQQAKGAPSLTWSILLPPLVSPP